MKKKIFSVLLCITMLMCSSTGCGVDESSSVDSTVEQSQSVEYKTIKPPEDGWSIEELLNVTTFFGHQLSYPLTPDVLGDDFTIVTEDAVIKNGNVGVELDYQDEFVCMISYTGLKKIENIKNDSVIGRMSVYKKEEFGNYITINSISFGSNYDDVERALGTPIDDKERPEDYATWKYELKNDDGYLLVDFAHEEVISIRFGDF